MTKDIYLISSCDFMVCRYVGGILHGHATVIEPS